MAEQCLFRSARSDEDGATQRTSQRAKRAIRTQRAMQSSISTHEALARGYDPRRCLPCHGLHLHDRLEPGLFGRTISRTQRHLQGIPLHRMELCPRRILTCQSLASPSGPRRMVLDITMRLAVHAVRRIEGATLLTGR